MSAKSSLTGFDISDLLTRLIPGAILLFSFLLLFIGEEAFVGNGGQNEIIVLFLIISLLIGEFINTIRVSSLSVPNHFSRVLYSDSQDERYLGVVDSQLQKLDSEPIHGHSSFDYSDICVSKTINQKFELDDSFKPAHEFYRLLVSDLASNMTEKTRRLENIFIFYQNMKISIGLSIFSSIAVFVAVSLGFVQQSQPQTAITILIGTLSFLSLYMLSILFGIMAPADKAYVESLLADYFTYIKTED